MTFHKRWLRAALRVLQTTLLPRPRSVFRADPIRRIFADPNQIYNPFTATLNAAGQVVRTPVLDNQLNTAGTINPVSAAYLKLFPQPNTTGSSTGQNNYISGAPSVDTYNNEFGRLDYNASARDHIFGDFRHNYRTQVKNDFFGNGATGTTLVRENFASRSTTSSR